MFVVVWFSGDDDGGPASVIIVCVGYCRLKDELHPSAYCNAGRLYTFFFRAFKDSSTHLNLSSFLMQQRKKENCLLFFYIYKF